MIAFILLLIPAQYVQADEVFYIEYNSPITEGDKYFLNDYNFRSAFEELGYEGKYFGDSFEPHIIEPYFIRDDTQGVMFEQEVYFSAQLIGSGVSKFYVVAPIITPADEFDDIYDEPVGHVFTQELILQYNDNIYYGIGRDITSTGQVMYEFKGLFQPGYYEFSINAFSDDIRILLSSIEWNSSRMAMIDWATLDLESEYLDVQLPLAYQFLFVDGSTNYGGNVKIEWPYNIYHGITGVGTNGFSAPDYLRINYEVRGEYTAGDMMQIYFPIHSDAQFEYAVNHGGDFSGITNRTGESIDRIVFNCQVDVNSGATISIFIYPTADMYIPVLKGEMFEIEMYIPQASYGLRTPLSADILAFQSNLDSGCNAIEFGNMIDLARITRINKISYDEFFESTLIRLYNREIEEFLLSVQQSTQAIEQTTEYEEENIKQTGTIEQVGKYLYDAFVGVYDFIAGIGEIVYAGLKEIYVFITSLIENIIDLLEIIIIQILMPVIYLIMGYGSVMVGGNIVLMTKNIRREWK